jgi:hypothetical protein
MSTMFIRLSIGVFLLEIVGRLSQRYIILATLTAVVCWSLTYCILRPFSRFQADVFEVFVYMFQCVPPAEYVDLPLSSL